MCSKNLTLSIESDKPETVSALTDNLVQFNKDVLGDRASFTNTPVTIAVRNEEGELIGGAWGHVRLDWIFISILWVHQDFRGQGVGRKVLQAMEEEARRLGATKSTLDTFEFQAKGFYEKEGYIEFGRIENFVAGYARYWMHKPKL